MTSRPRLTKAHTPRRVRLRVDLAPGCSIGPGKIDLLEHIEAHGSLSQAARELGMSYRRAWLLLDDLNRSLSEPVVSTAVGGVRGGGAQVTSAGRALVDAYRAFEKKAQALASRAFAPFSAANARPPRKARAARRIQKRPLQR
jgi:molybdate transport system regulatory protein